MKTKQLFVLASALLLASCGGGTSTTTTTGTSSTSEQPTSATTATSELPPSTSQEEPKSERFIKNFTFTSFLDEGTEKSTQIVDGLTYYEHTMTKVNGQKTVFSSVEIDLKKVNIVAGAKNNESYNHKFAQGLEVPHLMAESYTRDTYREVYATLNADFFNPDPAVGKCVNAFVKDGFIVKNSHNDNNGYDYKNDSHDVPASYPMLFGIKGDEAQIAPMLKMDDKDQTVAKNKKPYVQGKLSYKVLVSGSEFKLSGDNKFVIASASVKENDLYFLLDFSKGLDKCSVVSIGAAKERGNLPEPGEKQGYLVFSYSDQDAVKFANKITKQSKLSLSVASPDGIWDGASTILGCRHNLVLDNKIASTLELETSNGAKNTIVPKSAVGLRDDGTVVAYAVEGLVYGKKGDENDPVGVSLMELAEYMVYNNIKAGANFDGGGSTQMIIKDPKQGDKVVVRSSDTASYEVNSTRKVANALLVVEK